MTSTNDEAGRPPMRVVSTGHGPMICADCECEVRRDGVWTCCDQCGRRVRLAIHDPATLAWGARIIQTGLERHRRRLAAEQGGQDAEEAE
jgi:hypothetical protein